MFKNETVAGKIIIPQFNFNAMALEAMQVQVKAQDELDSAKGIQMISYIAQEKSQAKKIWIRSY